MSITWIVLCFLASQSKAAWHQLPMSNIVQCELQKTKFTQKTRSRNQTIFSFLIIRLEPFTCRGKLLISIKFVLFRLFSLSLQNHRYQVLEKISEMVISMTVWSSEQVNYINLLFGMLLFCFF
jgi:hypothetical protein